MISLNVQPQSNNQTGLIWLSVKKYADIVAGLLRLKQRAWLNVFRWKKANKLK